MANISPPEYPNQKFGWSVDSNGNLVCYSRDGTVAFRVAPDGTVTGTGAGGAIAVTDGSTTVSPASEVAFSGATVSDEGGGKAGVAVNGGSQPVTWATVSLTNDQILALPSVYPEIIAPTSFPSYSGLPSEIFVPVTAYAVLKRAAIFLNAGASGPCRFVLMYGASWDYSLSSVTYNPSLAVGTTAEVVDMGSTLGGTGGGFPDASLLWFGDPPVSISSEPLVGELADNGLYLAMDNGTSGDLTGGDPANSLSVTVGYVAVPLS